MKIHFFISDPTRKTLKKGALPSQNMPVKSFTPSPVIRTTKNSSETVTARPPVSPLPSQHLSVSQVENKCYKNYIEFCERTKKLKFSGKCLVCTLFEKF